MNEASSSYGQYCPISRALGVLGERWALLIVRDMLVGATRFNDLARGLPGLSRSLLSKRLRQLESDGVVERLGNQYLLTEAGRELEPVVFGMGAWGARWAFGDPLEGELDAELLVWWMHSRVDTSHFPGRRHVLHLRFTDDPRPFWIVIEAGVPSVCRSDPGFDVDLRITSDLTTLYAVWLGRSPLGPAVRAGRIQVEGRSAWARRVPEILQLSPASPLVTATSR